MVALLRTKRMQLRNHAYTTSEAFKGLCDIYTYIYRSKFTMLEVRENEIALRKCLVVLRTSKETLLIAYLKRSTLR